MSTQQTVDQIINQITEAFNGLDETALGKFREIMTPLISALESSTRATALASSGASAEPAVPKGPKHINNYTLFQQDWRKKNPDEKEDVFKKVAAAWKKVSAKEKAEWKKKADKENKQREEAYIAEHGSLPPRGKRRTKPKSTNAFQQYVADFRKEHPDVGHRDVFREAGKVWADMDETARQPFVDRAEKEKARLQKEFEEEIKANPLPANLQAKAKKPKKLRPATRSGYIFFGNHWREKLNKEDLKGQPAMRAIGAAWKALSAAQQKKFNTQAEKANAKVIEEFMSEHPEADWTVKHQAELEKASA